MICCARSSTSFSALNASLFGNCSSSTCEYATATNFIFFNVSVSTFNFTLVIPIKCSTFLRYVFLSCVSKAGERTLLKEAQRVIRSRHHRDNDLPNRSGKKPPWRKQNSVKGQPRTLVIQQPCSGK